MHFLDQFSLLTIFLANLLVQVVSIEIGYKLGLRSQLKAAKAQASQVRSIMGAGLGLLAFMLAFTFASSQDHYETRVQAMLEETELIRNAFLQAAFLPQSEGEQARTILQAYANDRLEAERALQEGSREQVLAIINRSEKMQQQLWQLAIDLSKLPADQTGYTKVSKEFHTSVLGLIDIHMTRIEATALNRIPDILWIVLILMAVLSMLVMGYQAGLVGRRSPMATVTLAMAFAIVIVLITDLDRPFNTLFHMDHGIMSKLVGQLNDGRD